MSNFSIPGREADEFEREELLNEIHNVVKWAVKDRVVMVHTLKGNYVIETDEIVHFYFYPKDTTERIHFWCNKDSMKDIGNRLRRSSHLRCAAEEMWYSR